MRGTAAEFLAKYLLLEKDFNVADVLCEAAPQDIIFRFPGSKVWQQGQIKRAYVKAGVEGLWVNTTKGDGSVYSAGDIDYIVAVRPPEDTPAYWADIWLIPFEQLRHRGGQYDGEVKGRIKLTAELDLFKL
jgi:hypothetical protein